MLRTSLIAAAFALTLAGCASTAAAPTQVAEAETTKAAPGSPEEEICEKSHKTGSRFPQELCMTRAMWEKRREEAKEGVSGTQRNALRSCAPGPTGSCGG